MNQKHTHRSLSSSKFITPRKTACKVSKRISVFLHEKEQENVDENMEK